MNDYRCLFFIRGIFWYELGRQEDTIDQSPSHNFRDESSPQTFKCMLVPWSGLYSKQSEIDIEDQLLRKFVQIISDGKGYKCLLFYCILRFRVSLQIDKLLAIHVERQIQELHILTQFYIIHTFYYD